MTSLVSYSLAEGIATLTLDDGKANVMSAAMTGAISAALDRAQADGAVVLVTGRAQMFSGGFDLGVFKQGPAAMMEMLQGGAQLAQRVLEFPRPVVVACNGHAIAMGVFLLQCADVRIGVDAGARFHVNEVAIGMTVPFFALEVCRQRLTTAHLHQAVLTASPYNPQQALAAGFLSELCPADTLLAVARERALALTQLDANAFKATKQRLHSADFDRMRAAVADDMVAWRAQLGVVV